MPTIWIIGDSTVEDNKPPFRGWGWAIPDYVCEGVEVRNHALSGRSTRSFVNEGLFAPVRDGMKPGDLLLIQFGHNDEKDDPERHTDPATTFRDHLNMYINTAQQKGTLPVLLTPVSRRFFLPGGELLYTHGEYPAAVRAVAAQRGVPLVDLKLQTRQMYIHLGEEKTAELFVRLAPGENPDFPDGHDDKTHFNAEGARKVARLVVDSLRQDIRTSAFFR